MDDIKQIVIPAELMFHIIDGASFSIHPVDVLNPRCGYTALLEHRDGTVQADGFLPQDAVTSLAKRFAVTTMCLKISCNLSANRV